MPKFTMVPNRKLFSTSSMLIGFLAIFAMVNFIFIQSTDAETPQEQNELQSAMDKVLSNDRNKGIKVSISVSKSGDSRILDYDLISITGDVSAADTFRVILQFSEQIKEKNFDLVRLRFQGKEKFLLKGDYFQKLGREYSFQNPVYTVRTFTENVYNLDGSRAYPTWTGGMIGVTKKQMEDFNDFNRKWYLHDWVDAQNRQDGEQ